MSRRALIAASIGVILLLAGCVPAGQPSGTPSGSADASPSAAPSQDPLARLTMAQRVGQLFMVGTTATAAQQVTLDAVTQRHVGGVFLSGRSTLGAPATAAVVSAFTGLVSAATTGGEPLLVATDQEGGQVQVLQGPGFDRIPNGLQQGAMSAEELRGSAQSWGAQLSSAAVNMDLAPVVDLVPTATASSNPPIGVFQREFGADATTIVTHADAFRSGMAASGVETVIKHFPGLGYVTGNTDTTAGVTDTVTVANGVSAGIYQQQIAAGARTIMVSSAIYARIDGSAPAIFSRAVVTDLLRTRLGFDGVIMSDDLSGATQVAAWSPADRAILAIQAGADIVLVSKDPTVAAQMVDAVLAKATSDPSFAKLVDAAARRVIALKSSRRG